MAKKSRNMNRGPRNQDVSSMNMGGSAGRRGGSASLRSGNKDFKEIVREFASSPAFKYVAGGIATALLARVANNISDRYPELSNFIRENLDTVEGKLGEFRNSMDESTHH